MRKENHKQYRGSVFEQYINKELIGIFNVIWLLPPWALSQDDCVD